MTTRRRRSVRMLNPFARVEKRLADERMVAAIAAVEVLVPELRERAPRWFGGGLEGDIRARYMAVGFTASPDDGLEEGRAFVVDIRSGHVIWQRTIERRAELPHSVTALAQ
jgi:hypothetical protein